MIFFATTVAAQPQRSSSVLTPEAIHITDSDLIGSIGVGTENNSLWCYNDDANAVLISSAEREKEQCRLKLNQEIEKQAATFKLQIDVLSLELEALKNRHAEVLNLKERQIQDLQSAAAKRPNDNVAWWAAGSFITGAATVLGIFLIVK